MATKKNPPMTLDEVQGAIHHWVSDAVTYMESELSPERAKATEYYRGEKFGNEEQGRSQVVLTDVRDSVLAVLPSLVRLFLPTSGRVFSFGARPKSQANIDQKVEQAEQATAFVNDIVLQIDNNGFAEIHAQLKDGLIRKLGIIKYWWEDRSSYQVYASPRCDVLQLELLRMDPDVEIMDETAHAEAGVTFYDVTYKHWRREGVCQIRCVPPEEFLVDRSARSREDCAFMAHRTEKTRSELIGMGVDPKIIDNYGGPSSEIRQSQEEIARRGGTVSIDQGPTPATDSNLWIEAYPYLDVDGDGVAELVRVRCLGPDCYVVGEPEPVDERPFALFCPDPEPHVLIGQSLTDRVHDLQLMKSSVLRAFADGTADAIFPRTFYMEGVVDRNAMESTAIGQNIPVRDGVQPAAAILEARHEFDGSSALALLQYLDAVKTQRIGPLPATLDPDALQSTPETGVKAVVNAASEQLELIARIYAGTAMKQLGKGLLGLLVANQPRSRLVRLRDKWVSVDPREWDADMDVTVNVAIGTNEKLGILIANAAKQEQVLQLLGPTNPMVGIGQLLHSYRTILQLQGVPDVGKYWNDLPTNWQPPPVPPQPSAEMLYAQAEMQKAQAQLAKQQADFQIQQVKAAQEMADLRARLAEKDAELSLKRHEIESTDDRERDKVEAQIALEVAKINAQYNQTITVEQIRAQVGREKMSNDLAVAALKPAQSNGDKPKPEGEKPQPPPKPKGEKVTRIKRDAGGKISEIRSKESE